VRLLTQDPLVCDTTQASGALDKNRPDKNKKTKMALEDLLES
jgi:hypothetical protein